MVFHAFGVHLRHIARQAQAEQERDHDRVVLAGQATRVGADRRAAPQALAGDRRQTRDQPCALPRGAGLDRIPNALEAAGELGIAVTFARFNAALRVRHAGARPLVEDNSVRGPATTLVNARAARTFGAVEVSAELLNLLDGALMDADYFSASRLTGEPAGGEGVHSRTVEPRMVRVGAKPML